MTLILVLCTGAAVSAADFGLLVNAAPGYESGEGSFTGSLSPWLSASFGERGGLYVSGKLAAGYEDGGPERPFPLAELERTELRIVFSPGLGLRLGRQRYRDPGGVLASGLFDGLSGTAAAGGARLYLGVLYTGLVYKKTAEILMSAGDREGYHDGGTYFAPRRVLVPVTAEFPGPGERTDLAVSVLGQFDLNGKDAVHTQYLELRAGYEAADTLRLDLTGAGALTEEEGRAARAHFAAVLGADWDVPGAAADMARVELSWGSGEVNGRVGAFRPVSALSRGRVLRAGLPGLMTARVSYTARPLESLSVTGEAAGFWRTDLETFTDGELGGGTGRFLGAEAWGRVVWAPQSVLRFDAGCGVFIPGGAGRMPAVIDT
jgi:hypothetical protein